MDQTSGRAEIGKDIYFYQCLVILVYMWMYSNLPALLPNVQAFTAATYTMLHTDIKSPPTCT